MTNEESVTLANDVESHVKKRINFLAAEMRDDRNDGWLKLHYRNSLKILRDYINKALEE